MFALTVNRHRDIDLSAVGDQQPFVAGNVIGREALVEEVTCQMQRIGVWRGDALTDLHLACLHGQRTATADPITAQFTVQRKLAVSRQRHVTALGAGKRAIQPNRHITVTAQRHLAAIRIRHAGVVGAVLRQVVPAPGSVELDPLRDIDPRLSPGRRIEQCIVHCKAAVHIGLVENVACIDAATAGSQVGVDGRLRRE